MNWFFPSEYFFGYVRCAYSLLEKLKVSMGYEHYSLRSKLNSLSTGERREGIWTQNEGMKYLSDQKMQVSDPKMEVSDPNMNFSRLWSHWEIISELFSMRLTGFDDSAITRIDVSQAAFRHLCALSSVSPDCLFGGNAWPFNGLEYQKTSMVFAFSGQSFHLYPLARVKRQPASSELLIEDSFARRSRPNERQQATWGTLCNRKVPLAPLKPLHDRNRSWHRCHT